MRRYYSATIAGMGLTLCILVIAAFAAISYADRIQAEVGELQTNQGKQQQSYSDTLLRRTQLAAAMMPVTQFQGAWAGARLPEKDAADRLLSEIETIAQKQLGLVTDNPLTPQAEVMRFQTLPMKVQRVTLRASGKELGALVIWLGAIEKAFPAALVEHTDFSSNIGGDTALTVRVLQPLRNGAGSRRQMADNEFTPQLIAETRWTDYLPAKLKEPVPVGFSRNPLQPAVVVQEARVTHDPTDDVTPRVQDALDGKIRSVIRGASPLVVIDGRSFRTGEEIVLGPSRARLIEGGRAKLKEVRADRIILSVTASERPAPVEVTYMLPVFLHAR